MLSALMSVSFLLSFLPSFFPSFLPSFLPPVSERLESHPQREFEKNEGSWLRTVRTTHISDSGGREGRKSPRKCQAPSHSQQASRDPKGRMVHSSYKEEE